MGVKLACVADIPSARCRTVIVRLGITGGAQLGALAVECISVESFLALPYWRISVTASTMNTVFFGPSTLASMRRQNKCWWLCALTPDARLPVTTQIAPSPDGVKRIRTWVYLRSPPVSVFSGVHGMRVQMPVSLISGWMVPSWWKTPLDDVLA